MLGVAIIELGGGRKVLTDAIDHSVGLEMLAKIGDRVEQGQPLVRVFGAARQNSKPCGAASPPHSRSPISPCPRCR